MMKELEKSVVSVDHLSRLPSQVMERVNRQTYPGPSCTWCERHGLCLPEAQSSLLHLEVNWCWRMGSC